MNNAKPFKNEMKFKVPIANYSSVNHKASEKLFH